MNDIKLTNIARSCHEINRIYNKLMGCESLSWDDIDLATKNGIKKSVQVVLDNPEITQEQMHESWAKSKKSQGWIYGEILCYENKTHPCLTDYDNLSILDKTKDEIFISIVNILK